MSDILRTILAEKQRELESLRTRRFPPSPESIRPFADRLRAGRPVAVIAEIKRASPSAGWIKQDADVAAIAASYEAAGAAAISVLTDAPFFHGSTDDLKAARRAVHVPVLRKDFLVSPEQLHEARSLPADAVLLIAACLPGARLRELLDETRRLGMAALVEVHDEADVESALSSGAEVIGINNRDLKTFAVDLETTRRLRTRIPPGKTVVSESGIRCPEDLRRLADWGVNAALIGEAFMREQDPGSALRRFLAAL